MERTGFVFYRSFADAINSIGDSTIELNLYKAVVEYGLNGVRPNLSGVESAIFTLIAPQIDANLRRYENGLKGGKPKANQTQTKAEPKSNQTETKPKPKTNQTETKSEPKEKEKDKDKDIYGGKIPYGNNINVMLTVEEFDALGKNMGTRDRDYYINRLSDYLRDNPKKEYASHYRTIINWKARDEHGAELKVFAHNASTAAQPQSEIFTEALRRVGGGT